MRGLLADSRLLSRAIQVSARSKVLRCGGEKFTVDLRERSCPTPSFPEWLKESALSHGWIAAGLTVGSFWRVSAKGPACAAEPVTVVARFFNFSLTKRGQNRLQSAPERAILIG